MENPIPVDVNALSGLLAKAKSVMKKVESVSPITLSEATQRQISAEAADEPESNLPQQARAAGGYTREQVLASSFPQSVKEAMIKSIPAEKPFVHEDMSDLDDVKMIPNKRKPFTKQPINEIKTNTNSDLITISRGELKEMINESLLQFLTTSYNKNLTEDAIKKTINMLIKEGKVSINKKTT